MNNYTIISAQYRKKILIVKHILGFYSFIHYKQVYINITVINCAPFATTCSQAKQDPQAAVNGSDQL